MYRIVCFLHLIVGIILFCYLLILEINESIDLQEIRPREFYNYKINLLIIIFNISACISRFVSNGFFFLLIHYDTKIQQIQSQIILKNSVNSVMFPNGLNHTYKISSRKDSEPVFQISLLNHWNSAPIDGINLEERLNINNIYEDDSDETESGDRTVNMIRYDSAFLRNDMKKDKKVFSN